MVGVNLLSNGVFFYIRVEVCLLFLVYGVDFMLFNCYFKVVVDVVFIREF